MLHRAYLYHWPRWLVVVSGAWTTMQDTRIPFLPTLSPFTNCCVAPGSHQLPTAPRGCGAGGAGPQGEGGVLQNCQSLQVSEGWKWGCYY